MLGKQLLLVARSCACAAPPWLHSPPPTSRLFALGPRASPTYLLSPAAGRTGKHASGPHLSSDPHRNYDSRARLSSYPAGNCTSSLSVESCAPRASVLSPSAEGSACLSSGSARIQSSGALCSDPAQESPRCRRAGSYSRAKKSKRLGRFVRMSTADASRQEETKFSFGPYGIDSKEIFVVTELSFGFVNLRPVVPGHVLVSPKRVVARFSDLSAAEVSDLWITAQTVGKKLEPFFKCSSLTLSIQDGPESGQTVPHVHIHILPRQKGDFKNNDEIYDELDKKEKELGDNLNLDVERKDRTREEMYAEAAQLRALFRH